MKKLLLLALLTGCKAPVFEYRQTFVDQWWEPDYSTEMGQFLWQELGETCFLFESTGVMTADTQTQGVYHYDWEVVDENTIKIEGIGKFDIEPTGEGWLLTFQNWLSGYDGSVVYLFEC